MENTRKQKTRNWSYQNKNPLSISKLLTNSPKPKRKKSSLQSLLPACMSSGVPKIFKRKNK